MKVENISRQVIVMVNLMDTRRCLELHTSTLFGIFELVGFLGMIVGVFVFMFSLFPKLICFLDLSMML
jgi:hypothetical protein